MEEIATISKASLVNCGLQTFLKGKSYFEMRTLSPISNPGFLNSRTGLLYRMDRKSEIYTCLVSTLSSNFFENLMLSRIESVCECTCIHCLPCNGKVYFSEIVLYVQQMQP